MELKKAISKRVSVRYFDERDVPGEAIRSMIEAAVRAPTASGRENWTFVVFKSEDSREKIYRLMTRGMEEYYRAVNIPDEKASGEYVQGRHVQSPSLHRHLHR
ncbi:nitroreductase family protein [Thermococcus piezophilus]|uniref:nitroreductase family protein n=1 Tax=Thermococcus piezophilus TaxID=1712654 RepID=UPI002D21B1CF|nr:nitroreductase family protein [Thermococcus piezophilus]